MFVGYHSWVVKECFSQEMDALEWSTCLSHTLWNSYFQIVQIETCDKLAGERALAYGSHKRNVNNNLPIHRRSHYLHLIQESAIFESFYLNV